MPRNATESLQGRELLYRFLSLCFQQPPRGDLLTELHENRFWDELPVEASSVMAAAYAQMRRGLATEPQVLHAEFERLLVGPNPLPAVPRESVYRRRRRILADPTDTAIRRVYTYFGLLVPTGEADDHIALEFAFMSHLCFLEQETGLETTQAQRTFLHEHVLPWVPAFCADLAGATTLDYFRGLARLTAAFLEAESVR